MRRMAMAGGYSWVFDAGVGDSFLTPRVSWHSIPANAEMGSRLFSEKLAESNPSAGDSIHRTTSRHSRRLRVTDLRRNTSIRSVTGPHRFRFLVDENPSIRIGCAGADPGIGNDLVSDYSATARIHFLTAQRAGIFSFITSHHRRVGGTCK